MGIRNVPCICTCDSWLVEDGCPCRNRDGYAIRGYHLERWIRYVWRGLHSLVVARSEEPKP